MSLHPYRLGFAVKVLGDGGLPSADTRRWQSGPHLSRSLELLDAVFAHLHGRDIRVFRLSSSTVPYGTHPDLPELDFRRQLAECADGLVDLGAKAREYGLRLSTHPGQYTVISGHDAELTQKSLLDLEQDALLLDMLGQGPDAVVVVHVGGAYGDKRGALGRWARAHDALSERAQRRVAVEHDDRRFHLGDVLELHRRTGVRVVFDAHHHRCNPTPGLDDEREALAAAFATWPPGTRPKVHVSSPRTAFRVHELRRGNGRGKDARLVPPLLGQHADFVSPWDVASLVRSLPGPADVMLEAKAKDVALTWVRGELARVDPAVASAEVRVSAPAGRAPSRTRRDARSPARVPAR